jgi:FixJ family two-component response regulator
MSDQEPVVVVIDDDPDVREALQGLLETVSLRAALYASPAEFLASERPAGPCCIVLDVRLPGSSGLDFQEELARENISMPVIFITAHGDIPMSVRAMKAGAVEFLTKPLRDQDLLEAIQAGLRRDRARLAEERKLVELRERLQSLTVREREVMALLTSGRVNKQIAAEIGISDVTVRLHRGQIMRKMRAGSLAELIRIADRIKMDSGYRAPPSQAPQN